MKRYRVLSFDIDSRSAILQLQIDPNWDEDVRESHFRNKINTIAGVLNEYGTLNTETKIQNLIDLGNLPFSILAFHNKFLRQIRTAFVAGAYYPSLTSACVLGERILNHLILSLSDFYKSTPEYKKVHDKESFDNWDLAIDTLEAWNTVLPDVVTDYRQLKDIRNQKAIHFNPETEINDREFALDAIIMLSKIIERQFGSFGLQPWFIPNIQGESYIKKEAEKQPFIQKIYLPKCRRVGPNHKLEIKNMGTHLQPIITDEIYEEHEITDEEFAQLVNNKTS